VADPVLTKYDDAVLRVLFELKEDEWVSIFDIIKIMKAKGERAALELVSPALAKFETAGYLDRRHDPCPPPGELSLLQSRLRTNRKAYVQKYLSFDFGGRSTE